MREVWILNGPNLNLLGEREPELYGRRTLAEIMQEAEHLGQELGLRVQTFQSNFEGELIERLHQARGQAEGLVLNPGGLSHTSVALRDAVAATSGYEGLTGTLTCSEFGDCADPKIAVNHVENGEFVPVWNNQDGSLQ